MATTAEVPMDDDDIIELYAQEDDDSRIDRLKRFAETDPSILTDEETAELSNYIDAQQPQANPDNHYANLAEFADPSFLSYLAQDVILWVDRDEESRADWQKREARGIRLMGVTDSKDGVAPFKGASIAVHPMMAEACTQYQARAMAEIWPAEGPVRTKILGTKNEEVTAQANRVGGFMNHLYLDKIPSAFDEEDMLQMRLPISGSCFKKLAYDPLIRMLRSEMCESADVIVPYSAKTLMDASRYTHRYRISGNVMRQYEVIGWYMEHDGYMPLFTENEDATVVHDEIDAAEGRMPINYDDAGQYTILECMCELDIPGFEHTDQYGRPTGIKRNYLVTVDKDNQVIKAIRRAWRKDDPLERRRVQMVHKKFLPGFGFYGFGYAHMIGSLGQAATGALRSLLDAGGFANMQGGFKSRDAKMKDDSPIGMGEFREVDMNAEELKHHFLPFNYKEPSRAMFELLGLLTDMGRRFASTTENMVGEANNNGPVGTTLALIEQGLKVYSGIHKRIHIANGEEYRIAAELIAEFMPEEYPYAVEGEDRTVFKSDFDDRVDVVPVSDPNIVTSTQRIAQSQSVMELADRSPDLYDRYWANHEMLQSLRVEDIDRVLPPPAKPQRLDPVSENVAMMKGQPANAFPDQDHLAHHLAHKIWWENAVPDDMRKDLEPIYKAHQAEHQAEAYKQQMLSNMGADPSIPLEQLAQDPAIERQLSTAAAGVAQLSLPKMVG